jgi:hypothetical protein
MTEVDSLNDIYRVNVNIDGYLCRVLQMGRRWLNSRDNAAVRRPLAFCAHRSVHIKVAT